MTSSPNKPLSSMMVAYQAPGSDRAMSDAIIESEISSMNCVSNRFAEEKSRETVYHFLLRTQEGSRVDAFFMPVDVSFGGQRVWHTERQLKKPDGSVTIFTTVRATVWFGNQGFASKRDIQFTLESRDFPTLFQHALAVYEELTDKRLVPDTWSGKVA